MAAVWFAHGMESGPWGRKITALAAVARRLGFDVESPDYQFSRDPDARVRHLLMMHVPRGDELVLVGSSMGGYVSAVASHTLHPAGLFLMAPAFYMPGYEAETSPRARRTVVVHGWGDEVVPVSHSWEYAQRHRCALHVVDADHGLADALPHIEVLFADFLRSLDLR